MSKEKLWLSEAMLQMNKKLKKHTLNIINSHAGSGKTKFIFDNFLEESYKYVDDIGQKCYISNLNRVLYVCDTTMLKSSVLQEAEGFSKLLEKGDLIKAKKDKTLECILEDDEGSGCVKVITYSSLSFLLNNEKSRHIILNYFDVIILDEIHNLVKYKAKFDTSKNRTYGNILDNIPDMLNSNRLLLVGLTATPWGMYHTLKQSDIITHTIFNWNELNKIREYTNKHKKSCQYIINEIKELGVLNRNWIKNNNYKVLIYTNTINMSEKYKKLLLDYGFDSEWLCSINSKQKDSDGKELLTMNRKQINLRNQLLATGMLPDDLDVLIINGAYETGWNLYDKRVQVVIIDDTEYDTQIQARNRVRYNIDVLITKAKVDSNGFEYELDQYRNECIIGEITPPTILAEYIDEEYIGVKLSKEDKEYLVNRYGIQWINNKTIKWKTFKKDLEQCGFFVESKRGTYIYRKEDVENVKIKELKNIELYQYIKTIVGIKLYKDKQKELAMNVNVRRNGKLIKGYKDINEKFEKYNVPYRISKINTDWDRKLEDGTNNPNCGKKYWIIDKIVA